MSKTANKPHIILVLGMHRSGTSLVAQLISKWGAFMGADLMPATSFNPEGYWEYQPLVEFHEKMLNESGSSWYAPVNIPPTDELIKTYGTEARQLVEKMDQSGKDWCWKDPRIPLFLDFWKAILEERKVISVVAYRHPFKIASSLSKRDIMPAGVSTALWEIYSCNIFQYINHKNSLVVDYDQILASPETEIGNLFRYLDSGAGRRESTMPTPGIFSVVQKKHNHEQKGIIFGLNPLQQQIIDSYEAGRATRDVLDSKAYLSKSMEITRMYDNLKAADHFAQLYPETKSGKFENEYSYVKKIDTNKRRIAFGQLKPFAPHRLRIDPLNDYAIIRLNDICFLNNGEAVDLKFNITSNAIKVQGDEFGFDTTDPQLYLEFKNPENKKIDEVSIGIEFLNTGPGVLRQYKEAGDKRQQEEIKKLKISFRRQHDYQESKLSQLRKQHASNHESITELNATIAHLNQELLMIQNSPGYKAVKLAKLFITPSGWQRILDKLQNRKKLIKDARLIRKSGYFDAEYYLRENPDVEKLNVPPLKHFLQNGGFEGRSPSEAFDSSFYLQQNPDVLAGRINPLVHYLQNGRFENRMPLPPGRNTKQKESGSTIKGVRRKQSADYSDSPHFSPPLKDYSLQVPFDFEVEKITPQPSIAVICHLFYTDLIDEIKGYLENIPYLFDLFISTDTADKKTRIERVFEEGSHHKVQVKVVPNRGRDIAPKLMAWPEVYAQYEFFLHIHSKKSVQQDVLSGWRTYLFETLLGSENTVKGIFEMFNADKSLGIIAPQHFLNTRHNIGWGWNFEEAKPFARKLGIEIKIDDPLDFPSGSMLWGRSAALKPLLDLGLKTEDFPPEDGQIDHTLAHVIERMYFFVCEIAGYSWIKINSHLNKPMGERDIVVSSRGQLKDLIPAIKVSLLQFNKIHQDSSQVMKHEKETSPENETLLPLQERLRYARIHAHSSFAAIGFDDFVEELKKHIAGGESILDFDEGFYLKANPDVAKLIANGVFECGFTHYCLIGKNENRLWSNHQINNTFNLDISYPDGMLKPVNIKSQSQYAPIEKTLKPAEKPFMLILFSHLQRDLFYAGYRAFFKDFASVFPMFDRILLSVENEPFETALATNYHQAIEVIPRNQLYELDILPDLIVCFNNHLVAKALKMFNRPERTVYFCQEFEAGFFPYGTEYVFAEKAIAHSENIIVSTIILREFLEKRGLLVNSRIFTGSPEIDIFDVKPVKNKKLFFYFRPEYFHARNIPEIIWESVHEFCHRHTGYDLYLVGSIDTRFSLEIDGNRIFILSKLPNDEYIKLISSCDVVVSMIYSAHPGVVAFQAAASGIPTVTNVFDNRDAGYLRQISENIVPYDPITDSLTEKIEMAAGMPKGKKSFRSELYGGNHKNDLNEFIMQIIRK
jgi:hypothetical protein